MARGGRLVAVVMAVALSMGTGACDSDGGGRGGATGPGSDDGASTGKVLKIGVIAPLSGGLGSLGAGIKTGVELAVRQANDTDKLEGYTLELAAEDDEGDPKVGADVAEKLASDDDVVGVVGTLNSTVATEVAPILEEAGIVMVSPANAGPELTGRDNPADQIRRFKNYFRVATTDDVQGPFAAMYASAVLEATEVAIVHDKTAYGQGLADGFKAQFEKDGGKVVLSETISPGDKDFADLLTRVKQSKAALVFYGGGPTEARLLSAQAQAQNLRAPLMGGDAIYSEKFFEGAGTRVGELATSVGGPTDELDTAEAFVEAYEQAGFEEEFGPYGAYAYDAANVIIGALAKSLDGADEITDEIREDIISETQEVELDGATGKISFDEFGDVTTKVLTVYEAKVKDGKPAWVASRTDTFP